MLGVFYDFLSVFWDDEYFVNVNWEIGVYYIKFLKSNLKWLESKLKCHTIDYYRSCLRIISKLVKKWLGNYLGVCNLFGCIVISFWE